MSDHEVTATEAAERGVPGIPKNEVLAYFEGHLLHADAEEAQALARLLLHIDTDGWPSTISRRFEAHEARTYRLRRMLFELRARLKFMADAEEAGR